MTRSWIGRIWTCLEGASRRNQLLDKIRVRDPLLALFLAFTLLLWGYQPGHARGGAVQVDAELVFAVDVSYSMDQAEQVLQRNGYAEALVSEQFLQALKGGLYGKIAIAYLQWASYRDQDVILPWTLIDGPESAAAAAAKLRRAPYRRAQRTSVSGAIDSSMYLFENNGYDGLRRIIDVSGDGPNNDGRPVEAARDAAVAAGVTINGLPLVGIRPYLGYADIPDLDLYYQDCVIGGDGAFMIAIHDRKAFVDATRTKLVQEIAAPLI
ncbi:MAG: DUF1194 domain-containing protein, partial [Alphaproteobacteria bacterium]|nr:DUF1194 domain-containing protein [Alphaproteobacteria bacterium]